MKKIALLTTLALVIGLFATQAFAYRGQGYRGDCPRFSQEAPVTAEQQAEFKKFYDATTDLRTKLQADRAEMQALMRGENPDPAKVRALAESMAQTRDQMVAKADEMGIEAGPGSGYGCGGRGGYGGGYGRGGCGGYGGGKGRW